MIRLPRYFRDLATNPQELRKVLFVFLIFLALVFFAKYIDDFIGQSLFNIILTHIGFAILAFFNVYFVPLIAIDKALSWRFMTLMIIAAIIGTCVVSLGYFFMPVSLVIVGGSFTLIHLFIRTVNNKEE